MMYQEETTESKYRWYILILATVTYALIVGAERMCLPPLFPEIVADLNMTMTQMGTVWGMDPLAGVFVGLVSGLLIDRFGIKWTLAVTCLLAGITGAARGLSTGFTSMTATMFMFGLLVAMMPTLIPKVAAVWFASRNLALANGVLSLGMTGGAMIGTMLSATILSPLLGGWSNVLFFYGAPPVLLGILWWVTGREPAHSGTGAKKTSEVPFSEALPQVIRLKGIWWIGFVFLGAYGAFMGLGGYLPTYLRDIGWAASDADSALTLIIGATAVTSIPMALLSDKLGSRKKVLVPALIVSSVTLGLIPLADGMAIWGLLVINGLVRGAMFPLFIAIQVEQKGVGARYAGTAVGLTSSLGMLGAFAAQPLGMNLIGIYGVDAPLYFWAGLSIFTLIGFFFVKELPKNTG
jgi:cyanate permease